MNRSAVLNEGSTCVERPGGIKTCLIYYKVGVDRYVFFRADTDTDYYRSSRPITDIFNRYICLV